MTVWAALVGGFAGTLVLTTVLRAATELHLTRMDLPFLLGTAITANRSLAKLLGYAAHFVVGLAFALGYYGIFLALGRHDWWLGALLGLGHGVFAGTVLINLLLPLLHPRMGTPLSDFTTVALLEAPGFLGRNYGPRTAVVNLAAHVLYGTVVAVFLTLAS
jgi:Zn-dependent membrane protease YugP